MKNYFPKLLLLFSLFGGMVANAQDTLKVDKVINVKRGEELRIQAGTLVVFMPGARIWVEGTLLVSGNKEQPVKFINQNPNEPGVGIVVNGIDLQASIEITHATFVGLLQPIIFEPFWSRKKVSLSGLQIYGSEYSEALVYVATPLANQNVETVQFSLSSSQFYNNKSGIIIDNVGGPGIRYELNNLIFEENALMGGDSTLGILHLNIASPYLSNNLQIGNIALHNNFAGSSPLGVSLAGSTENVYANALYTQNAERRVYDYYADPRLPALQTSVKSLNDWPGDNCFIQNIKHKRGLLLLKSGNACKLGTLRDINQKPLPYTQHYQNDSLRIQYTGGPATQLVTDEGMMIQIPEPEPGNDSLNEEANIVVIPLVQDSLQKPSPFLPSFEVGAWGGIAFYVGDLHHKFGIPGVYEWTGGLYLQYNNKENWSYRGTFYRTNIGMHDPSAALMIWQNAPTFASNNGTIFQVPSFENNFKTKMFILDFDAIYYFAPKYNNRLSAKDKEEGKWIPGFGFGAGIMRFDPYKMVVYSRYKDTAEFISARKLGMEGQNFLSNKKDYGAYTLNFNVSFQLAYVYKKFRFRYEVKAVLSLSDYLDDYGQGYTYGGNYDEWLNSVQDIDMPVNKYTGEKVSIESVFPAYNSGLPRTYNMFPDMFFQQHIGISYDLGDLFKKK